VSQGYDTWKHRDAVVGVGSSSIILPALRTHLAASITPHPSYNADNWVAHPADLVDLAVIRLDNHIAFGDTHNTASVVLLSPKTLSMQSVGTDARTCGWGATSETNQAPAEKIQCFEAPILANSICKWSSKAYYDHNNPATVDSRDSADSPVPYIDFYDTDYNLCVAGSTSYSPACLGQDAGSPLIVQGTNSDGSDASYVAGVFSGFAPKGKCRQKDTALGATFPNYYRYTSTLKFGPWIQEVTGVLLPGEYPLETREISPPTMRSESPLKAECGSGNCDSISASHLCWCDLECASHGDCCSDHDSRCKKPDQGKGCSTSKCGYKAGNCWCDAQCKDNKDCCDNYDNVCGKDDLGNAFSCRGRCGKLAPSGCSCHGDCLKNFDCCTDWAEECPAFVNDLGEDPKGYGTCKDNCGKNAQTCWCDPGCLLNGDCCYNFEAYCSTDLKSCDGYCGGKAMSDCWCDVTCKLKGDCCKDYNIFCHEALPVEVEEKLALGYLASGAAATTGASRGR
jgi:hypothetical protein